MELLLLRVSRGWLESCEQADTPGADTVGFTLALTLPGEGPDAEVAALPLASSLLGSAQELLAVGLAERAGAGAVGGSAAFASAAEEIEGEAGVTARARASAKASQKRTASGAAVRWTAPTLGKEVDSLREQLGGLDALRIGLSCQVQAAGLAGLGDSKWRSLIVAE